MKVMTNLNKIQWTYNDTWTELVSHKQQKKAGIKSWKFGKGRIEKGERKHEWPGETPKNQNQRYMDAHSWAGDRTTCTAPSWFPTILVFMASSDGLLGQQRLPCCCTWYERLRWYWFSCLSYFLYCFSSCWRHHRPYRPFWWTKGPLPLYSFHLSLSLSL